MMKRWTFILLPGRFSCVRIFVTFEFEKTVTWVVLLTLSQLLEFVLVQKSILADPRIMPCSLFCTWCKGKTWELHSLNGYWFYLMIVFLGRCSICFVVNWELSIIIILIVRFDRLIRILDQNVDDRCDHLFSKQIIKGKGCPFIYLSVDLDAEFFQ